MFIFSPLHTLKILHQGDTIIVISVETTWSRPVTFSKANLTLKNLNTLSTNLSLQNYKKSRFIIVGLT